MKIVIPTYKRVGKVKTLEMIPKSYLSHTSLCVAASEEQAYKDAYPGVTVFTVPSQGNGIANVREEILNGGYIDDPKIIMMDDDCVMGYRYSEDGLGTQTKGIIGDLVDTIGKTALDRMSETLDVYAHAGWSEQMLNRSSPDGHYNLCFKALHLLCYNRDLFPIPVKFNRVMLREDYDVTLQLLRAGKPNYIEYRYSQGAGASHKEGGCKDYRTLELHNSTAHDLKNLHPEFVTLKTRASGGDWFGKGVEFTDVNVQWKKAFKSSDYYKNLVANGGTFQFEGIL